MNIFFSLLTFILIWSCVTLACLHSNDEDPSSFDFFRLLKGYQKGHYVTGVHDLKKYIKKFGYVNYKNDNSHADDDDFDDLLEDAIKKYQQNFRFKTTGALDDETISIMVEPRCGVPDIIRDRVRMGPNNEKEAHDNANANIHTTSYYSFFDGNPKWQKDKSHLTMAFDNNVKPEHKSAILRAFDKWASVSYFTFLETNDPFHADILVGFYKGDHNDDIPFDGTGGVFAHGFEQTEGELHFDAEEQWSVGAQPYRVDVKTVAMHEIGHLLGLGHTSLKDALMYLLFLRENLKVYMMMISKGYKLFIVIEERNSETK